MHAPALRGAYVELSDLLALRHRPAPSQQRTSLRRGHQAGSRLSKLRGRGVDFSEVRLYQPGDDVRSIEWRVTARKNKPHTKVFREERERPTLVVVDQSQSLFFGSRVRLKSVAGAELGANAAWRALAHNDRVGGLVLGNAHTPVHKPLRSVKAVARLLADLAQQNQALSRHSRLLNPAHYRDSLQRIRRLAPNSFRIVLISDFLTGTDAWHDVVPNLARHNDLTLVRIADPLERTLPMAERYSITDGSERWQFHSGNRRLRAAYADQFERRDQALRSLCANHAARFISVMTDDDPAVDFL